MGNGPSSGARQRGNEASSPSEQTLDPNPTSSQSEAPNKISLPPSRRNSLVLTDVTEAEWLANLTPEQYAVLRKGETEEAFSGVYHNHTDKGLYLCAGCEEPLFSCLTKYDAKDGYPSFSDHLGNIRERLDPDGAKREAICRRCQGHIGYVYKDGPADSTGLRYSVNSVALMFQAAREEIKSVPEPRRSILQSPKPMSYLEPENEKGHEEVMARLQRNLSVDTALSQQPEDLPDIRTIFQSPNPNKSQGFRFEEDETIESVPKIQLTPAVTPTAADDSDPSAQGRRRLDDTTRPVPLVLPSADESPVLTPSQSPS